MKYDEIGFSEDQPLPHTAYELIDLLDEWFPHQCIGIMDREIDAHRYAGTRDLVDTLVEIKKAEIEEAEATAVDGPDGGLPRVLTRDARADRG